MAFGPVFLFALNTPAQSGTADAPPTAEETSMTEPNPAAARIDARAEGTFDVQVSPLEMGGEEVGSGLGRMSLEKTFHGDLEGTSRGQMLTAGNVAEGSAGYVAIEKVTGNLAGRDGSFVLQHTGTMDHGSLSLSIAVVPGSGTGELIGLAGSMSIEIESGKHSYRFDYSLPAPPAAGSPES